MTEILTSNSSAIPTLKISHARQQQQDNNGAANYSLRPNSNNNRTASAAHYNGNSQRNSVEDVSGSTEDKPKNASPCTRFEAFVMTGDKMIRVNPKISPKFAALKQSEISKHAQVCDESFTGALPTDFNHHHTANSKNRKQRSIDRNFSVDETTTVKTANVTALTLRENENGSRSENALNQQGNMQVRGSSEMIDGCGGQDQNSSVFTIQGTLPVLNKIPPQHDFRLCSTTSDFPVPDTPVYLSVPASPVFPPSHQPHNFINQQQSSLGVAAFSYSQNLDNCSSVDISSSAQPHSKNQQHRQKQQHVTKNGGGESFDSIDSSLIGASTSSSVFVDDNASKQNFHNALFEKLRNRQDRMLSAPASAATNGGSNGDSTKLTENQDELTSPELNDDDSSAQVIPRMKPTASGGVGARVDLESAKILAKRLYNLDGFRKSDVARHLAKNNEFGKALLNAYIHLFDFDGMRIDEAIRILLSKFCLIGETYERERILTAFSKRYYECNSSSFKTTDEVHALSCALLLLNTDLHGKSVKKRMKFNEFSKNISNLGYAYNERLLKSLYYAVKRKPIEFATDEPVASLGKSSGSADTLLKLTDKESNLVFKKGWVLRKCVTEENGKSTPFGRRTWRMFYATIKGPILYLHQDEFGFKKGSFLTLRNAVKLFHAYATVANDYLKKQHVFRLQTSSGAEYLFQAADPVQMKEWIDEANFSAARYSAPSLPAPIGSQAQMSTSLSRRFCLPKHRTTNSYDQQIKAYGSRLDELRSELDLYHKNLPSRQAKSKTLKIYAENEIYLLMEIDRYSNYVHLLKERQSTYSDNGKDRTASSSSSSSISGTAASVNNNSLAKTGTGSKPVLSNLMESSVEECLPADEKLSSSRDQEMFDDILLPQQPNDQRYPLSLENGKQHFAYYSSSATSSRKSQDIVDAGDIVGAGDIIDAGGGDLSAHSDRSSYKAAVRNSVSTKTEKI